MKNKKDITFQFGIRKIQPISFLINERVEIPLEIAISYGLDIAFDEQPETVDLIVNANFTNPSNEEILYTGSVLTKFYLKGLNEYVDKEKNILNLPNNILEILFSIAFTHTRSVLATYTNGTKFGSFMLPVINPAIVLKQLYDALIARLNIQHQTT